MSSNATSKIWDWTLIVGGVAMLLMAAHQAQRSLSAGVLQFSSPKYGFVFSGLEAAAVYAALMLGAGIIIGIGWRGLRLTRGDA